MQVANVLFVLGDTFNPIKGGVGRVTDSLCKGLQKKGYNVFFLHLRKEDKPCTYATQVYYFPNEDINSDQNIAFYRTFLKEKNIQIIINQAGEWFDSQLFLNVEDSNIKKISCYHSRPLKNIDSLKAFIPCRSRNTPIQTFIVKLLKFISYPVFRFKFLNQYKQHFTFLASESDNVVFLSKKFIPQITRWKEINIQKFTAIPNPNSFEHIPFISEKKKQLLFVGRLTAEAKQPEKLIKIWERLYQKYPDWELIICGDGLDREILEKRAKNLDRTKFVGYQDPQIYYKDASIFCLTSVYEGFPMVLMESMQYSMIPIAYNSFESASDIIEDGINGFLIKPYSIRKYVEKLSYLMSLSDEERLQIASKAYKSIQKYNIENIIPQWVELFNKLLKE
jgi:glycosyltransferase involved in cell wall biosynthesis